MCRVHSTSTSTRQNRGGSTSGATVEASHELLASPPTVWPHEWELRAYRKLFYETNFWTYFQNTIIVSAVTTLIVLVAG
jgi:ABC-type glycerol-3-phosphate transport system permease component